MLFILFRLLAPLEKHWTKNFWTFLIRKKLRQVQIKRKLVSYYSRKIPAKGFKFVMLLTYCKCWYEPELPWIQRPWQWMIRCSPSARMTPLTSCYQICIEQVNKKNNVRAQWGAGERIHAFLHCISLQVQQCFVHRGFLYQCPSLTTWNKLI